MDQGSPSCVLAGARASRTVMRAAPRPFLHAFLVALFFLALVWPLRADTISGTVKDPSGAVVVGARVEVTGGTLTQPVVLASDGSGRFTAPNLSSGKYSVRVTKDGFQDLITPVDLQGTIDLSLGLTIAPQEAQVSVTARVSPLANSDPIYRQLRDITLGDTYHCEDFPVSLDVGTFVLKRGTITLLKTVEGMETGAIFVGQGHFSLKPVTPIDQAELMRRAGSETLEEDFTSVVFRFTAGNYPALAPALSGKTDTPAEANTVFEDWKKSVRRRHDVPEGFTQAILEGETMDNVDADLLMSIYNPHHPPFLNAYIHGTKHKDLRFFVRARVGAIPQMDSPEEVGLINCAGDGTDDGVWYLQHFVAELKANTASSLEDKRLFATRHYVIETDIGKNAHLYSRATITFEPLVSGERVLKFGLLPTLRVARVTDQDGQELHFIQEDKKQDGTFYAILNASPEMGKEHSVTVEYAGDKVLTDAGSGSFYIGARDSWYPNLNGFGEMTTYDLTFKVPPKNVLISVGKLVGQSAEGGFAVSHWVTPAPVAVAGFNYGQYKEMNYPDPITHYTLSGYYLTDLPDTLKPLENGPLAGMSPTSMTEYALDQTRAQMQLCTFYFGKAPYDDVNITEQPNFSFGQSWPDLVYLPIAAYIDSTQRWMLFGINQSLTGFVREVTPHEVAHQWFGHGVGWASYHDQWLSEGFAEFAAGLFLQQAMPGKWQSDYLDFWERERKQILDKNNFGVSPNDAGPLWLGERLISPHSAEAYQGLTYAKGAYVLLMLRSLLYEDQAPAGANRDQAFIDMMHDYMNTYHGSSASTESFIAIVNKHVPKNLDLQSNGRLDWFFREWVYGTQVPRYQFKYDTQANGGKFTVRAEITQSEVDPNFAMFVPVFADFGQGMVRLGQVGIVGNSTRTVEFMLDRQPKKVALNYFKDVLER